MTNMLGRVIFVDNQCLRVLKRHQHEARNIIGKPMHEVLGCDPALADRVMAEIGETGQLAGWFLDITDSTGSPRHVRVTGLATRDDDNKFVGADITLEVVPDASEKAVEFSDIQQPDDTREEHYLQAYFKAQIGGLYDLVMQWGGRKVARSLEDIINETGQRNVWPITMTDGYITVQLKRSDTDIYRALLARAISYASSIIGAKIVRKELERVNKKTDPSVLDFMHRLGIDLLYNEILNN
jgi:hypothetical protein